MSRGKRALEQYRLKKNEAGCLIDINLLIYTGTHLDLSIAMKVFYLW